MCLGMSEKPKLNELGRGRQWDRNCDDNLLTLLSKLWD